MTIFKCQGGCGRPVTEEGKWCSVCFFAESVGKSDKVDPIQTMPDSNFRLRMDIHNASFRLCFGTKAERDEALDKLALLVHVLQQEQHKPNQEKET